MSLARRAIATGFKAVKAMRDFVIGYSAMGVLSLLRLFPAARSIDLADRVARRLGPLFGRHRVALDNLRHAYPEKSEAEIEQIAVDMWGNMARLAAEYIYLDKLYDWDRTTGSGERIEVVGHAIFDRMAATRKSHILFTGHIGNFELLPICAAELGISMTALFRPPNNPYIARYIARRRKSAMGSMLPSQQGAAIALARILEGDGTIGVLVDQKFTRGVRTTFFGRPCETNPLLPKLARNFESDVYPAHCIRLPGNKFKLIMEDKLDLPRTENGRVDVERTAQLLNDVVERWVRENPAQWMWFHKRWKLSGKE